MSQQRFSDRVAVVTGAASGFGEAIATSFAREGAAVVAADVNVEGAGRVVDAINASGGNAIAQRCDVSQGPDWQALVQATRDTYGRLDVLVNNAGYSHRSMPLAELPEADYDAVFATNTKSVYLSVVHGLSLLEADGGGVIVNTASIGARRPRPGVTAYNATKGAVLTLTRGLAGELAASGVRVNAVNPVAADTDFMKGPYGGRSLPDRGREVLVKTIPLGRLTEPADVASAVLFLASDEAGFLTGVCLDVDGGRSIG